MDCFITGQLISTIFPSGVVLQKSKVKYWSVKNNMEETQYSIKNVVCKPWRNIYEVNAPNGIIRIDIIFNGAGLVTGYEINPYDMELLSLFQNEENISYKLVLSSY